MFILKNFDLSLDDYINLFSVLYNEKFDTELLNLLILADQTGFFDSQKETLYLNIIQEFLKSIKNIKKAISKFKILIENSNLKDNLEKNDINIDFIKETLRTKLRSYYIFKTANQIVDKVVNIQNSELMPEQIFWDNISDLEKELFNLKENLSLIENKYNQFDLTKETLDFKFNETIVSPIPDIIEVFETQRLYLISGISKVGKSFFALNLFERFWELGYDVLYISLENTMREVVSRLLSIANSRLKFSNKQFNLRTARDIKLLNEIYSDFKKYAATKTNKLKIIESPLVSINIFNQLLNENSNFKIVFIDWIDLISSPEYKSNMFLAQTQIIRELYDFCKRNNNIIIAVSQLNREAMSSEVKDSRYISRAWSKIESADASIIIDKIDSEKILVYLDFCRYLSTPREKIYEINFSFGTVNF